MAKHTSGSTGNAEADKAIEQALEVLKPSKEMDDKSQQVIKLALLLIGICLADARPTSVKFGEITVNLHYWWALAAGVAVALLYSMRLLWIASEFESRRSGMRVSITIEASLSSITEIISARQKDLTLLTELPEKCHPIWAQLEELDESNEQRRAKMQIRRESLTRARSQFPISQEETRNLDDRLEDFNQEYELAEERHRAERATIEQKLTGAKSAATSISFPHMLKKLNRQIEALKKVSSEIECLKELSRNRALLECLAPVFLGVAAIVWFIIVWVFPV